MINIGDKVKFLNDVGGGRITKIVNKNTVCVLNEDGFEIPVLLKEIIVIDEKELITGKKDVLSSKAEQKPFYSQSGSKQVVQNPKREQLPDEEEQDDDFQDDNYAEDDYVKDNDELCVYVAFIPKDSKNIVSGELDLYLINDSNYVLFYNIAIPVDGGEKSVNHGKISPNIKEKLISVSRETVNSFVNLHFQALAFKNKPYRSQSVIEKELNINAVKFFKYSSFKENDFFDEPSLIVSLFEENQMRGAVQNLTVSDLKKVFTQKEIESEAQNRPKKFRKPEIVEEETVDLHIQELIEDERGLTNGDILQLQLDIFNRKMKDAIEKKLKRVVFIHGVGNGKLKTEIRRELDRVYKKCTYQDASFREYGWGATLVILTPLK